MSCALDSSGWCLTHGWDCDDYQLAVRSSDDEERRALVTEGIRQKRRANEYRLELEALREGRCLDSVTHRDEEHRQSICVLAADHTGPHDDALGCTWTDGTHY